MSPTGALSQMCPGELAGRALPSSYLRVGSSTELSKSSPHLKALPQYLSMLLVCVVFLSVWLEVVTAGYRSGQCECQSQRDAVTPQGLC